MEIAESKETIGKGINILLGFDISKADTVVLIYEIMTMV
jgi:hypothetical protein